MHRALGRALPHTAARRRFPARDRGEGAGVDQGLRTIPLRFSYAEQFGHIPEAYETLLADVATGDQTLFVRSDEVEAAWGLYMPLLENRPDPLPYTAGSWGPEAARTLLGDPDITWATGG